ncbi:AtpZ/AtpI family protein [Paenibacillus sp. JX-17]|uniref:AtpZ/AtpI family protein n=1 Tax=Paenibacillus lacisoli TaxID=3064525 RepID=A0ABT9CD60_9BACL|nr:AtpZ/AtpI family protein [Paenibacillus sp. JX-17]MDO7906518.1 AtpZ/AtpI family protein [Paenibacillus sp. JX-17]
MVDPKKPKKAQSSGGNALKALGLVSAIGVNLAVCTLGGFYLGTWLDKVLGGKGLWIAVSVFLGLAVGGMGIAAVIRKVMRDNDE